MVVGPQLALPLMVKNKNSALDLHLVKQAPPPWKLKGEAYILLFKFQKEWVKDNGFLPPHLEGKFKGGLGYVMLVNYQESPVGPYREILFIPGKFRKSNSHTITKIYVDSEPSKINGRANWGIPKETLPISWEKEGNTDLIKVYSEEKTVFSAKLSHGIIPFPVTTTLFPIRLCQTWEKVKYFTKPTGTGWGKLAKIEELDIDPDHFPDFSAMRPLLTVRVSSLFLEFPEPKFKDEAL
jgi:hypothetical protein